MNVPGGIVSIQDCREPARYSLAPNVLSFKGLLESIVEVEPKYQWRIENGVVNLFPRYVNLSFPDYQITSLMVENAETLNDAVIQLLSNPDVQQGISKFRLEYLYRGGIGYYGKHQNNASSQRFSLSLRNITLREALNAIVRAHKKGAWIYTEGHCNGNNWVEIKLLEP
jgi:hypothetical protein